MNDPRLIELLRTQLFRTPRCGSTRSAEIIDSTQHSPSIPDLDIDTESLSPLR